jgi:hypothetical protein
MATAIAGAAQVRKRRRRRINIGVARAGLRSGTSRVPRSVSAGTNISAIRIGRTCGLNLALVEGMVEGSGAGAVARLAPEDGYCCVRLSAEPSP